MIHQTQLNLDRLAAQHAQAIVSAAQAGNLAANDLDNTVTKALGVLQENGVYAFMLFLLSRTPTEQPRAKIVRAEALAMLGALPFDWGRPASEKAGDILAFVTDKVVVDLERMVLAKEILEQMLIYARYGAKAWVAWRLTHSAEGEARVETDWLIYPVHFRLRSSTHVGRDRAGNVQRTRPYLTGRNFWGTLTERITRNGASRNTPAAESNLYRIQGDSIHRSLAYTYFFPAVRHGESFHILWPWAKDRESSLLQTYPSTALVYPNRSAQEASLHETEYLAPHHVDTGEAIYLVGYVFEKQGERGEWKKSPWRDAVRRLQFGGERSYGWGWAELVDEPQATADPMLFNGTAEFVPSGRQAKIRLTSREPNDWRLLAHTVASDKAPIKGKVEPLVGREWQSDFKRQSHSGQHVAFVSMTFAPGSMVMEESLDFVVGNYGVWQMEQPDGESEPGDAGA